MPTTRPRSVDCAFDATGQVSAQPKMRRKSRRLISCPHASEGAYLKLAHLNELGAAHVRSGSQADMCAAKRQVRFAPNSDRKSGHRQTVMSALPLEADMCSAQTMSAKGHKRT
jgi:hypothetical protein